MDSTARSKSVEFSPIEPVVELVFSRWTSHVLWTLGNQGRLRFKELHARVPAVTPKVLTERLRQLERNGLVTRVRHREMPSRVEYEPTPLAESLRPVLGAIIDWSEAHLDDVRAARRRYDRAAPVTGNGSRSGGSSPA